MNHPAANSPRNPAGPTIDVDACLARRPAGRSCNACVDACPSDALAWSQESVEVKASCHACGRCAAACPTGAIHVTGFEFQLPPTNERTAELVIECERVPALLRRTGAGVVPCLGGITPLQLCQLAAQERAAFLIEHGWCSRCSSGGKKSATTAYTVAAASALLLAAAGGDAPVPRLEHVPLSLSLAEPESGAVVQGQVLGRRSFLSSFRAPPRVVKAARNPRHVRTSEARRPSVAIGRHMAARAAALAAAARQVGHPLQTAAFPSIHASENCCHEGVCAAACPSGALRRVTDADSGTVGLDFANTLCLGCGICAKVCPHGALSISPAGALGAAVSGPTALTRHAPLSCTTCGDEFLPAGEGTECQRCAMQRTQVRDLFGARRQQLESTSFNPRRK